MGIPSAVSARPEASGIDTPSAASAPPEASGMDTPSAVSARPEASASDPPSADMVISPMAIPMEDIWVALIVGYIWADLILDLPLMDMAFPTRYFIDFIIRDAVIPMVLGYPGYGLPDPYVSLGFNPFSGFGASGGFGCPSGWRPFYEHKSL